jgi:hypothetical protein
VAKTWKITTCFVSRNFNPALSSAHLACTHPNTPAELQISALNPDTKETVKKIDKSRAGGKRWTVCNYTPFHSSVMHLHPPHSCYHISHSYFITTASGKNKQTNKQEKEQHLLVLGS